MVQKELETENLEKCQNYEIVIIGEVESIIFLCVFKHERNSSVLSVDINDLREIIIEKMPCDRELLDECLWESQRKESSEQVESLVLKGLCILHLLYMVDIV